MHEGCHRPHRPWLMVRAPGEGGERFTVICETLVGQRGETEGIARAGATRPIDPGRRALPSITAAAPRAFVAPFPPSGRAPRRSCFIVPHRSSPVAPVGDFIVAHALPLARLLSLLGCSEEAACLSFEQLQRAHPAAHDALGAIAQDERHHDALLRGLLARLPDPGPQTPALAAMRRVHSSLGRSDSGLQCAAIVALDSAVCVLLSQMLRCGPGLAMGAPLRDALGRIRDDEARHVAVTRAIALCDGRRRQLRDVAAQLRVDLADALALAADDMEVLGFDPDPLLAAVGRLPAGLL